LPFVSWSLSPAPPKFDLSLTLHAGPAGLQGGLTYAEDLFDGASAGRLTTQLVRVLEQVADHPARRLSGVELLSRLEREALLSAWRPQRSAPPAGAGIHARFEGAARRTPDAPAVVADGATLTYAELDARADRIARHLRALGVGPEVRVGLLLERSPGMVVAILGVLKAGGAYVPIDPRYPPERVAYLVEDSGVPMVIVQEETRATAHTASARALLLDDLLADGGGDPDATLPVSVAPENAAYVIYTSGSTGRPKGVVVTHANVLRLFDATEAWFGFGPADAWVLFHSYAFDFSVWEIWGALLYGGRLVVVPFTTSRDPAAFRALLARERVTVLNQTPSAFRQLVHADSGVDSELALQWVVFGGEALEPQSLKPWFDRHGDRRPRLVNMYGITETTVHVTFRPLLRRDAEAGGSMVGEAIPDLGVYLLDSRLEPVAPGVPGEIFVGGAGAARGYLGRPALTAERFLPDPYSGAPGARMYRSGDRARRAARGDTEYLGRVDQQVKVRGFRIEPGEVEAALVVQPGVREAVVVAREDEPGAPRLVAYLVPEAGVEPSAAALRTALGAQLPEHMVPAAFVPLEALPLTAHGKIDRRSLPAPAGLELAAAEYVPPRDEVEAALAGAWADALRVERVGAHDNYFALGGDSMRAIQTLALARARGVAFSLADLFRFQTVAELAAHVRAHGHVDDGVDGGPFSLLAPADRACVPAGVEDAYPMTRLQLGMLFHSESRPGNALYHNVQSFRVRATFDAARLRRALAALAARHPILRTSFDLAGFAEPMQLVHRTVDVPLTVASLEHLPPARWDEARTAWLESERNRPFDWRAAPLIRFHVHVLGPDTFRLGFAEHHAILDGWSVAALVSELLGTYLETPASQADAPPASVLREFVVGEREVIASAGARAFWQEALAGSEPAVPASSGAAGGDGNRMLRRALPAEVSTALAAIARGQGLPPKSLLLAAHLRVMGAAAGVQDVTTGLVVNGRPEGADAERALGLFLNTVPCRVRLSGGSWVELARAAFDWERTILPFRRFPVAEVQRILGGRAPFETSFNFVNFHRPAGVVEREGNAAGVRRVSGTNFSLAASFEQTPGGFILSLEYDAARFLDAEAEVLFARYLAALDSMVGDPHGRYDGCDLMSVPARARVQAWTAGEARPAAGAVHAQVAACAAAVPGAAAVSAHDGSLTRADLDRASRGLAAFLRARGVGAESRVGVCLERSAWLSVALLAVLRTGAAYVPLDPDQPDARLAWMLDDSGARILLARGDTARRFAGWDGEVVALDDHADRFAAVAGEFADGMVHPDSLAYVIYTSGSTGRPKGVGVPHRALSNHMAWMRRAYPLTAGDRVLQKTPVGFDASVWEFWAPLTEGATLVMAPPGAHRDPAALVGTVRRERITVLQVVPSVLQALLEEPALAECPTLRRLFCGGEALPAGLARRAAEITGAEVVNLYGPTETCIDATSHVFAGDTGATVPIGRPVDNVRVRVLDAAGAAAAPGIPGELHVGGVQVSRGYLGQPGLTAERFVPDPFAGEHGARLYRTGDRVRWLSDGALEFLGRVDQQVKVRGARVEPGEVEVVLACHPAVAGCAVQPAADAGGATRLVAYVVPAPGAVPSPRDLRAHLRERLPELMVPASFVTLDALPRTPGGKLDRRALPAAPAGQTDASVAPRDALELRLAGLWEEVLGAPVGVREDFFDAGGHSLAALRLLARVERLTGRRLPMATLLAGPTVERMAAALRLEGTTGAPGPLVPLRTDGTGRPLFLVHAAGGGAASYAVLARHLDAPLYGLQSRGLDGDEVPRERVEEMAADYVAGVRAVQPAGPYRLGGWSMGGLVAFEMARGLEAAGEEVELLALIDSRAPREPSVALSDGGAALVASFAMHLGLPRDQAVLAAEAAATHPPGERLRRAWEAARAADLVPEELGLARFERLWEVFHANVAAAARYRPEPCASDLLLVMPGDRAGEAADEAARWGAITRGGVQIRTLGGDHFSLVREPHVRGLAALLCARLAAPAAGGDWMTIPVPRGVLGRAPAGEGWEEREAGVPAARGAPEVRTPTP
jgi:amino acid adenylation domain-containing protein